MNIDELKQNLTAIASEADDSTSDRLGGVDSKVGEQRRNAVVGTVLAASVAIAAVALAPAVLGGSSDPTRPADDTNGGGLPVTTEQGVSMYTSPAGAKLIAHAVAAPGELRASVTFTPTTSDLSWTDFCYDAAVRGNGSADYWLFVNGRRLTSSTCQDAPGTPLDAEANFNSSPALNAKALERYGVEVGKPATFTVKVAGDADRAVAPQPGIAVYERGEQVEQGGVWFGREVVYRGHTYRLVGSDVTDLDGQSVVRAQVDLPQSDHRLYVMQGAANVPRGLQLFPDSVGVSAMGKGITGSGGGRLYSSERTTALVRAHPMNPDASGQIYVLVYEQIN
jgi:hypothetical protein